MDWYLYKHEQMFDHPDYPMYTPPPDDFDLLLVLGLADCHPDSVSVPLAFDGDDLDSEYDEVA